MNRTLFDKLLTYFNITEDEYASLVSPVDEINFTEGRTFEGASECVKLVKDVIANKGKITIYGDYDADGIMGTSILVKMFEYVNYPVTYYIPNRYQDGYGITLKKAQEYIDEGIELVICVDNGISAFEPIELLRNNGVKVLVLDHHQPQENLPLANAIMHPQVSKFSDIASSGGFVAFMFSISFLGRFDKFLSTLAAISTISDMMPLKGANRRLLRFVFSQYKEGEFLPIDLLKETDAFDETSIGMRIAPKINSVGRLIDNSDINKMVEFFTSNDREIVLNYIDWINENNENRKLTSKEATEKLPDDLKNEKAIVYLTDCKEGILGLIANHLCSNYHVPVIVLTEDSSGDFYKGSCRAPEGYNVVEIFGQLKDLLLTGGGHAGAGGCTFAKERFTEFKEAFIKASTLTVVEHVEKETINLSIVDINLDNYNLIKSFSPFGECWKAPLFKLDRIATKSLFYSRTNEHILTQIGQSTRLTGFNFPKAEVSQYPFVDMIGTLRTSTYRGITNVEFLIKELKESAK